MTAPFRLALPLVAALLAACSLPFADLANLRDPRTVVDESANGTRVALRQGNALVVRLPFAPADGAYWELKEGSGLASPVRGDYAPAAGPANLPAQPPYSMVLAGLNSGGETTAAATIPGDKPTPVVTDGLAVFRLRAVRPGSTSLQFDYRNAADPAAAPAKSVRIDVDVVALL